MVNKRLLDFLHASPIIKADLPQYVPISKQGPKSEHLVAIFANSLPSILSRKPLTVFNVIF